MGAPHARTDCIIDVRPARSQGRPVERVKESLMPNHRANALLGYPPDARLLILNADDFGMYHAVNAAILRAFTDGVLSSTTVMVPCP